MRILHTSDWHLGRIFCGVHLTSDQEYVLENLLDVIRDGGIDVVVIAGDVFDRAVPPVDAVNLLDDVLNRIVFGMKKPVIAIAGNHDSPDRLAFGSRFFTRHGLHVFGQAGPEADSVVLEDKFGEVLFCPIPYAEAPFVRDALQDAEITSHEAAMAALVRRAEALCVGYARRVAVAHTFVAGGLASESERPLAVGGTAEVPAGLFSSFNYTALGHLHRPQKSGGGAVYSGSLLKYSFDEAKHRKSATIAELDGLGAVTLETVELKPQKDVRVLRGTLEDLMRGAEGDPGRGDYVKAVLTDEGALFDAMGRLRHAYPNALEIEREFLTTPGLLKGISGDYRRFTDIELFCDFYSQVMGRPLTEQCLPMLRVVLEETRSAKEEQ
jgi:DNA repair protein SbcD/Mre11